MKDINININIFRKNKLFGNNIPPSCEYCLYVKENNSGKLICSVGGSVHEGKCGSYSYDPLKREPKPAPNIPEFSAEDFKL